MVDIGAAVLQEDAEGFGLGLADPERNLVGAAHIDEGADQVEDAVEHVGPIPRGHEGADRAGAAAADGMVVGVRRKVDGLCNFGNELFDEEVREIRPDVIVFPVAAEACELRGGVGRRQHCAGAE